jgi:hypothetical protein
MPRRPGGQGEDRFLRANLSDPDNQAALLRAYLDLKQTAEELSLRLARATEELAQREANQAEAVRQAREAGGQDLAAKEACLDRLGQAMRLIRWAVERSSKGASFLSGARHGLSEVIAVASSGAENGERVRYDKTADTWAIVWRDGRPDTVIAVSRPSAAEPPHAAAPTRRRRTVTTH